MPKVQKKITQQLGTDVPDGWLSIKLGDGIVDDVQPGFACGTNSRDASGVAHMRPMNVSTGGSIDLENVKYIPKDKVGSDRRWICQGDVLFNNTNSPVLVGKTALYTDNQPRAFSNHMTRIRCNNEFLDGSFCAMYLHQRWRGGYFFSVCNNHVSQASVSRAVLLDTPISLPPLAEQRRIVAKVEELLAEVNAAHDRLDKVPSILKRFRQSVLSAACSGKLTEDWRADHICEATELALSKSAKLVDAKSIRRLVRRGTKGLPEPEIPDTPSSWARRSIRQLVEAGAILDFQDGNHGELYPRASDFGASGVKFLTAAQVFDNRVLLDEAPLLVTAKAKELRIGFTKPGDVLLTHNATIGRVAVVPKYKGDIILGTSVTYYRTNASVLLPEYLCCAMQGHFWQGQLRSVMEQTTRNQVSITKQVEFLLLVPPVDEQRAIVQRIAGFLKLADHIEERYVKANTFTKELAPSIFSKAFRGELVPTEAELAQAEGRDYEPASVLLERIQAVKKEKKAKKPRRTRRRTAKRQRK